MINDGRRDPIVSIEHIALATQDGDAGTVPGVVGRPYRDVRERVPPDVRPTGACLRD